LQNEQPEMQIASADDLTPHQAAIRSLATFFGIDQEDLVAYYRKHGKLFFSIREWFDWIGSYDLSIGTRFHGNIAALLNGVPAIILTHDSRTRELCEFAAIPNEDVSNIDKLDVHELYEKADFELFEKRYSENYRAYIEFFDRNGIEHCLA
jgi:polysaccharide pyruvyl transferase WcaK-like protein